MNVNPESWPWLPVELVEHIILEAWSSALTVDERTSLFISLCEVNHTWLSIFIRIALKDVHIACPLFSEDYLRLIRERSTFEPDDDYFMAGASATANTLCRSLTFHVDGTPTRKVLPGAEPSLTLYSSCDESANAVSSTLYMVTMLDYLPNLRQVSIEYVDWGFDDIFDQGRLQVFPDQVTHLELKFTFTSSLLVSLVDALRSHYYSRRWCSSWELPNVRHLIVSGAPLQFVSDIIETCPNLETVEVDGATNLAALTPVPWSLHTLTLRMPPTELSTAEIEKWKLSEAFEAGLLSRSSTPAQILVQSGQPEASGWEQAKKLCNGLKIQLVHCPLKPMFA
ncbi:hypothetical protein AcW1_006689 [Taiwanofungus camphoratus]|nr:hypothetical protein AcV5_009276 [Antrodia cinnamomea]KAI0954025.1 hypothetical protein AcV7_007381 [Antrodia cinnamomea]KAI0954957.1 hypothetical protein AcW1_006689 [Antrodia cinnamomea]